MKYQEVTYLWVGSVPSTAEVDEYQREGFSDMAAFVSQWNTITAIEDKENIAFDIINSIRVPSFPKFKKLIIPRFIGSHRQDSKDVYVNYLNFSYFGLVSAEYSLINEVKRWSIAHRNDKSIVVILASLTSRFLNAGLHIKKLLPHAIICCIVTDLPQFMNRGRVPVLKKILKHIDWIRINRFLPKVDKYLLYTRYMADFLKLPMGSWIEYEGIPNKKKISADIPEKYNKFTITYAGSLASSMNIMNFVNAFIAIDRNDIELHIFGFGDSENELIEIQKIYPNIIFKGFVSNHVVFTEMQKSTLLVLPRPTGDEYTKYSCPSKIFEYLASGTPILTTKLEGIPEEYYKYLYIFDGDTFVEMRDKLKQVIDLPINELDRKGTLGRNFLINHKSPSKQAEKILDFILKETQ